MATALRIDYADIPSTDLGPVGLGDGSVRIPAYLARTGVQSYRFADGSLMREYRPPEEVFAEASLASWRGLTLTDGHPTGPVLPDNWRALSVGHVGDDIAPEESRLVAGSVIVKDAKVIRKIADGELKEISCGYVAELDFTPGVTPDGEPYDAIQRNIRGNHVALGPRGWGRAGNEVALNMDGAERSPVGRYYECEDNQAMAEPTKTVPEQALTVPLATYEKACAERDDAKDKLTQALAAHAAELTKVRADSAATVAQSVALRVSALKVDSTIALDGKPDREIMLAVIAKVRPEFKADGRSDEYIRARFDSVCEGDTTPRTDAADAAAIAGVVAARVDGGAADDSDPLVAKYKAMLERNRNAAMPRKGGK